MNEDNKTEKLRELIKTYESADEEAEASLSKKEKKRLEAESLSVFGKNQNEFNEAAAEGFDELWDYCHKLETVLRAEKELCKQLSNDIASLKKELDTVRLRSTLNSNQIEKFDGALYNISERAEEYILSTNPGARHYDLPKGCREADLIRNSGFYEKAEAVRSSYGSDRTQKISDFEVYCTKTVCREFSALEAYDEIYTDFIGDGSSASDRLFENLQKNSAYKINKCTGAGAEGRYFVYCSDTLSLPESVCFKSGLIVLTGENPLSGINSEELRNMVFLNDCGLHEYIVISTLAFESMKNAGFRGVRNVPRDFISGVEIIRITEKAIENAVPGGAVSFDLFRDTVRRKGGTVAEDVETLKHYYSITASRKLEYPYDCLKSLEKVALVSVIKNRFLGENITKCDILSDKGERFDLVTGFDYVGRLKYSERKKLYSKAKELMNENGVFVFSAADAQTGIKLRAVRGWDKFGGYEAMWTRSQLIQELQDNGFKLSYLVPVGAGLFEELPSKYKTNPVYWIVGVTV